MSRETFMERLEYLLQDIPQEEVAEALQYYRDYFDEAGADQEQEIIKELGSPERIAAIIRTDLSGNLKEGGEFTEAGYQDSRFRDPNYQLQERFDLPDVSPSASASGKKQEEREKPPYRTSKLLKVVLWIILGLVCAPFLVAAGGTLLGVGGAALGILAVFLVSVGVLAIAFLFGGVATLVFGIIKVMVGPVEGILVAGAGLAMLGLGCIFFILALLLYGRFIPFVFRKIVDGISSILYRRKK